MHFFVLQLLQSIGMFSCIYVLCNHILIQIHTELKVQFRCQIKATLINDTIVPMMDEWHKINVAW